MAEQPDDPQLKKVTLARAFSIPFLALFFAVLLIYTGPLPGDSHAIRWITFPDTWGGDSLRNGLRNIAITFGLSCFPGAVIGTGFAWLITRHAKVATGSLIVLRVCQWAPFLFWWILIWALIYVPSERPGRYFFVWTMGIPAVALGSCYHIVCLRMLANLDWQRSLSETASLAIHRGIFISIVLTLSVWTVYWVVYPANDNVVRHYVAALILMLFLFIANWTTQSDVSQSAELRKQLVLNDVLRGSHGTFWIAALMVGALGVSWELLNTLGYFRVSLLGIVSAIPTLFMSWDLLHDISSSLLKIVAGCAVSGILVLIISPFISPSEPFHKWSLPLLSLTFAIPMMLLPGWHGWILSIGRQSTFSWQNLLAWQITCVATLSFFPLMQILWTLSEERLTTKLLLAVEQALPYGFAAILYGEMMSATRGLGFAVVVATATQQLEKGFAIFFITLSLLLVLTTTLRFILKRFFPPRKANMATTD